MSKINLTEKELDERINLIHKMMQIEYYLKQDKDKELEWYRSYGSYINTYHNKVDAEACEYADQEQNNES
jgi:3-keto-L-gulonate-6-phosphate decarboxylase